MALIALPRLVDGFDEVPFNPLTLGEDRELADRTRPFQGRARAVAAQRPAVLGYPDEPPGEGRLDFSVAS